MKVFACTAAVLLASAVAQQVGTLTTETHPALSSQSCTAPGSCTTESTKVVIDANWRWLHKVGTSTNCYSGNTWDATICTDAATCTSNCALDGADYSGTYGVTTSGNAVTLKFVTHGPYSTNIGSRLYMMQDDANYKMFKLLNKELAFDVDMSQLPCGLNGALYFTKMDQDGGMARFPTNKAGAKYGTGYCDAQCPRDLKFINGQANSAGWAPNPNDPNAGNGAHGSCCPEMDIWEANTYATAFTSHPCSVNQQTMCSSDVECGSGNGNRYTGLCDMDGCDFNAFRLGAKTFLGPDSSYAINTKQPMTVVTQFITSDGTDAGSLVEIRRVYKQNGVVIANANIAVPGVDATNSITEEVCEQAKVAFDNTDDHKAKGGLKAMGEAMRSGMVMVMSLWDDHAVNCLWLDSKYPTTADDSVPGVLRGLCPVTSGVPTEVEAQYPNVSVTFSNIKVGALGSTTSGVTVAPATTAPVTSAPIGTTAPVTTTKPVTPKPTTTPVPTTTPIPTTTPVPVTTPPTGTAAHWAQCGGNGWKGPTVCEAPYTCVKNGDWYSQCL